MIDVEKNLWAGLQELAGQYDAATSASVSTSAGAATTKGSKRNPGGAHGRWGVATRLVHPEASVEDPFNATNPPLYQTATFGQPSATENGPYDYTRSGNPTRDLLEKQMAELVGGTARLRFPPACPR